MARRKSRNAEPGKRGCFLQWQYAVKNVASFPRWEIMRSQLSGQLRVFSNKCRYYRKWTPTEIPIAIAGTWLVFWKLFGSTFDKRIGKFYSSIHMIPNMFSSEKSAPSSKHWPKKHWRNNALPTPVFDTAIADDRVHANFGKPRKAPSHAAKS